MDLDERRFRRVDDAQVHVLSHGLHYGTGVFEGIRRYATEGGPAIFRHREHLDRLAASAELYHLPLGHEREQLRSATHELIRRNGLELLHPPARFPRLRGDGAVRADRSGRRDDRRLALGRLPRGGQAARRPGQGLVVAADLARGLIPHAKATGST